MAFLTVQFFSDTLGREVSVNAIIPQYREQYKTLYLLHGLSDNHTAWHRYTNIEQYALRHGIAVIMPDAERSFYTDMKTGDRYFSFMAEELPAVMRHFFKGMSAEREENFVAGLSMGGYGAMKLALNTPERYFAAGSFSGALDIPFMIEKYGVERKEFFENIFGTAADFDKSENDILYLLEKNASEKKELPKLYLSCGAEDRILPCSRLFVETAQKQSIPLCYREPHGNHNWAFWNDEIKNFLDHVLT